MKPDVANRVHKRRVVASLIAVTLAIVLAVLFLRFPLIPRPASLEREFIDNFLRVMLSIAGVIFALIATAFTYSLLFFRRRTGDERDGIPYRGYLPLELAWTLIPLAIVVALGISGGVVLNDMTKPGPPQSELRVNVMAFRWGWQFEYPDSGVKSFDLELPVGRRVVVSLQSRDVVHSFWVPEFGPKQDAVPGMTTELRFTPTIIGKYQVVCSQLCGVGHTYMVAPVSVVSPEDFETWLGQQQAQQKPPGTTP